MRFSTVLVAVIAIPLTAPVMDEASPPRGVARRDGLSDCCGSGIGLH